MSRAVIFDFYGTLAHWADRSISNYSTVFAAHGYELPDPVLGAYFARYDGVDHAEHSTDSATYEAWVRRRLGQLAVSCGVASDGVEALVEDLREADRGPMVAYPDAAPTLAALREQGWAIGVCSNWGWELDGFLDQVGLLDLIDSAVTSARAGARKPHPNIYAVSVGALGVRPEDAVFVGDTWGPDVEGPCAIGMTAIHVWRNQDRQGDGEPRSLSERMHRVGDLREVLDLLRPRRG